MRPMAVLACTIWIVQVTVHVTPLQVPAAVTPGGLALTVLLLTVPQIVITVVTVTRPIPCQFVRTVRRAGWEVPVTYPVMVPSLQWTAASVFVTATVSTVRAVR